MFKKSYKAVFGFYENSLTRRNDPYLECTSDLVRLVLLSQGHTQGLREGSLVFKYCSTLMHMRILSNLTVIHTCPRFRKLFVCLHIKLLGLIGKEKFQDTKMQNQNYRKTEQIYVRKGNATWRYIYLSVWKMIVAFHREHPWSMIFTILICQVKRFCKHFSQPIQHIGICSMFSDMRETCD